MRLGGFYTANTVGELESLCRQLDTHGLSAIGAPRRLAEMSDEECVTFGGQARSCGIVIGALVCAVIPAFQDTS